MTNRSASSSRASSSLARSLSITASTPTSVRSAPGVVHRRDAAAAGADHDRAVLEQPADRPDLEDPPRPRRRARPAASCAPSGLTTQPFSAASAVAPRPRRRSGRRTSSDRRTPGRPGRPRPSSGSSPAASRTAAGCRAPARAGSRSSPRSPRRGRRAGRARRPCTPSACSASRPTCGPLPCERTSSCSAAIRASARAADRTLARWRSAVIGSPRRSRALPPRATTTRIGRPSAAERRDHDGLDRVHPVLGLVEHDRALGLEDVVR